MKTMNVFAYALVAGATLLGTACSTMGTGAASGSGAGSTSGSGAGAGTTSNSSATGAGTGSVGPGTDQSSAGSMTTSGAAGTGGSTGAGGDPTDMTAFMGTFATMPDATFLLTAASSNLLEIQAGQIAAQKATNADVKKFAQMMVDHHTKATQQLQAVSTPLGVKPSQAMMPIHQAMADKLSSKSGKDFDEEYMDAMETAHTMDIAMFEVKSKAAETPTVQAFATKTLPMLRSHRTMAGELEKKID